MILPVDNTGVVENALKNEGVYVSLTSGVSMKPLFKTHRDVVVISPPTRELRKYDVALYTYGDGRYILHRVVGVRDEVYLIRGDNTYAIERIRDSEIIGILMEFDRGDKHYTVDNRIYKIYSVVWNAIYPIRRSFSFMRALIFKLIFFKKRGKL